MTQNKIFQIKGELSAMMVLYLKGIDLKALEEDLSAQIDQSPQLFKGVPFVVDLSAIGIGNNLDLNWLKNLLTSRDLVPVGLRHVNADLESKAKAAGWAILADAAVKTKSRAVKEAVAKDIEKEVKVEEVAEAVLEASTPVETTMHVQQVRSGQQLSVVAGDLVVVNSVNEGAELLVDGNIHIYGALRGRALAGIHGNRAARIFCQSLEAELVSIAGFYKMEEDIPENLRGKMVQIYLDADEVKIEALIK
ncbi:MAG TPA: septum site-determining protein MinC [Candidatus Ignatzschineria merdigallinarum]|uniref:Probable septum site-determining protein MinC n=1 Tax=Candidatus Ignatzschineria merdigallinarum TaxID=2838621 RepID=A0A9D1Q749_9GAMM|nr:septum site-determining protein MinC [Candidatus Ignatzschineria merdigallinarum]